MLLYMGKGSKKSGCMYIWNWFTLVKLFTLMEFPCSSVSKESAFNAGDLGLIPGSGSSPGEENGNLPYYSCLGNPMTEEPGRLQSMVSQ